MGPSYPSQDPSSLCVAGKACLWKLTVEGVGVNSNEVDMGVGFFTVFLYHDLKSSSLRLPVFWDVLQGFKLKVWTTKLSSCNCLPFL
jgi:hypothetical protein